MMTSRYLVPCRGRASSGVQHMLVKEGRQDRGTLGAETEALGCMERSLLLLAMATPSPWCPSFSTRLWAKTESTRRSGQIPRDRDTRFGQGFQLAFATGDAQH